MIARRDLPARLTVVEKSPTPADALVALDILGLLDGAE